MTTQNEWWWTVTTLHNKWWWTVMSRDELWSLVMNFDDSWWVVMNRDHSRWVVKNCAQLVMNRSWSWRVLTSATIPPPPSIHNAESPFCQHTENLEKFPKTSHITHITHMLHNRYSVCTHAHYTLVLHRHKKVEFFPPKWFTSPTSPTCSITVTTRARMRSHPLPPYTK